MEVRRAAQGAVLLTAAAVVAGLLASPVLAEGYVDALRRLLDPGLAAEVDALGARAHARVAGLYTFEAYVRGILDAVDEVVSEHGGHGMSAGSSWRATAS